MNRQSPRAGRSISLIVGCTGLLAVIALSFGALERSTATEALATQRQALSDAQASPMTQTHARAWAPEWTLAANSACNPRVAVCE